MKYTIGILAVVGMFWGFSGSADAMSYTFAPNAVGTEFELDHYKAVSWGIDDAGIDLETEIITGATVRFDNIRNWKKETNDLYVRLVDNEATLLKDGVRSYYDNQKFGDYFANWGGSDLVHYQNLGTTGQDLEYTFDADQLASLGAYLSDGFFGMTFDADCHFWNDGVSLEIETASIPTGDPNVVPEPATLLLLSGGVLVLIGIQRQRTIR